MDGVQTTEKVYTYTPTEQKRATTPKPPSTDARRATAGSRRESRFFGRLGCMRDMNNMCRRSRLTWKSRRPEQKLGEDRKRRCKVMNLVKLLVGKRGGSGGVSIRNRNENCVIYWRFYYSYLELLMIHA